MNDFCGVRGYMLRQDFSADFQIEISERVDAYRAAHDREYQRRQAERMSINVPSERAIPLSCETTVGKVENALTELENRLNDFYWLQGFRDALTDPELPESPPWPPLSEELQELERRADGAVESALADLPEAESQRGERYFRLRRQDIMEGAGYRYLCGFEYAFCILESTARRPDPARLDRVYAALGLFPEAD